MHERDNKHQLTTIAARLFHKQFLNLRALKAKQNKILRQLAAGQNKTKQDFTRIRGGSKLNKILRELAAGQNKRTAYRLGTTEAGAARCYSA